MTEHSVELLEAVKEIRELLRLLAEPAIAERDAKLREELRRIVGKSEASVKAVYLLDGTRTQAMIHKDGGIHKGHLSTLVKKLREADLLSGEDKQPKLAITLPPNFFEE